MIIDRAEENIVAKKKNNTARYKGLSQHVGSKNEERTDLKKILAIKLNRIYCFSWIREGRDE